MLPESRNLRTARAYREERDERAYQAWLWLGGIVALVVLAGWALL